MADIKFYCPACGKKMAIDEKAVGLLVNCPDCRLEVHVPRQSQAAPPVVIPPPTPTPVEERTPTRPPPPPRPAPEKTIAPTPPPAPKPVDPAPTAELDTLKKEQARLLAELNTARDERGVQAKTISELTAKLNALNASLERVTAELTASQKQAEGRAQQHENERNELAKKIAATETERSDALAKVSQLTSALSTGQNFASDVERLKKDEARLLAELNTARDERGVQAKTISELTAKLNALNAELASSRQQAEGQAKQHENERNELANKIAAAETERNDALAKVSQLTSALSTGQNFASDVERLKKDEARLLAELNTARDERGVQAKTISELTAKLNALNAELASSRQQAEGQAKQHENERNELANKIAAAETDRSDALAKVSQLTSALSAGQNFASDVERLKKDEARLLAELNTARDECGVQAKTISELTAKLNALNAERASSRQQAEGQAKQHENERNELANKIAAAETARIDAEAKFNQCAGELAAERAHSAEQQTRYAAELLALREQTQTERRVVKHDDDDQLAKLRLQISELEAGHRSTTEQLVSMKQLASQLEADKRQEATKHKQALSEVLKKLAVAQEAVAKPPAADIKGAIHIEVADARTYRDPFRLLIRRFFSYVGVAAVVVAIIGGLLTYRTPKKTAPADGTTTPANDTPRPPARDIEVDASLGVPFVIDDIELVMSSARVGPVTLISILGTEMSSDEIYLIIDITLSNRSDKLETIIYQPWNDAVLKDTTNRKFKPALTGQQDVMNDVKGRLLMHTLKPGEVVSDTLIFPWKESEASSFTLSADPDFRRLADDDRMVQLSLSSFRLTIPRKDVGSALKK